MLFFVSEAGDSFVLNLGLKSVLGRVCSERSWLFQGVYLDGSREIYTENKY